MGASSMSRSSQISSKLILFGITFLCIGAITISATSLIKSSNPIPNRNTSPNSNEYVFSKRFLAHFNDTLTDDVSHNNVEKADSICVEYVAKFLHGSTDTHDECMGLINAYHAAECALPLQEKDHRDSDNSNQHRVDIDDWIESWACCASMHTFYDSNCAIADEVSDVNMFGVITVLVVCALVKSLIRRFQLKWLTEVAGCILVGVFLGEGIKLSNVYDISFLSFDNDIFLVILLPPIVFSAALNIDKTAFKRYAFPITLYALFGTVISASLIGLIVHAISTVTSEEGIPWLESFLFGTLISSVDPVAILGIFNSVGISEDDVLYVLIFGEALLNDGVAIVFFDTLVMYLDSSLEFNAGRLALDFLAISIGSVVIGLLSGVWCTIFYWGLYGHQAPIVEVGIFFCWSLIPYYISNWLKWSGIVSLVAAGFVMDMYVIGKQREDDRWNAMNRRNDDVHVHNRNTANTHPSLFDRAVFTHRGHLSAEARRHVCFVTEVISSLMETSILAYLGIIFSRSYSYWSLNMTAIFACIVSRAVMVFVISSASNFIQKCGYCSTAKATNGGSHANVGDNIINKRVQIVLFFAGLRGAVSLALVENIPVYNAASNTGTLFKQELKAMTSSSIIFTVFVFGGCMHYLVDYLGIVNNLDKNTPQQQREESAVFSLNDEETNNHKEIL